MDLLYRDGHYKKKAYACKASKDKEQEQEKKFCILRSMFYAFNSPIVLPDTVSAEGTGGTWKGGRAEALPFSEQKGDMGKRHGKEAGIHDASCSSVSPGRSYTSEGHIAGAPCGDDIDPCW